MAAERVSDRVLALLRKIDDATVDAGLATRVSGVRNNYYQCHDGRSIMWDRHTGRRRQID